MVESCYEAISKRERQKKLTKALISSFELTSVEARTLLIEVMHEMSLVTGKIIEEVRDE